MRESEKPFICLREYLIRQKKKKGKGDTDRKQAGGALIIMRRKMSRPLWGHCQLSGPATGGGGAEEETGLRAGKALVE